LIQAIDIGCLISGAGARLAHENNPYYFPGAIKQQRQPNIPRRWHKTVFSISESPKSIAGQ
jgi:hypothetical protein